MRFFLKRFLALILVLFSFALISCDSEEETPPTIQGGSSDVEDEKDKENSEEDKENNNEGGSSPEDEEDTEEEEETGEETEEDSEKEPEEESGEENGGSFDTNNGGNNENKNENTKPTYTVEFDYAYGNYSFKETVEGKITAPEEPKRGGYKFLGWYLGQTPWNFNDSVAANVKLTAKWQLLDFNVVYHLNDGENDSRNPLKFTVNTTDISLYDATKSGELFVGWYLDPHFETPFEFFFKEEDIHVYARFAKPEAKFTYELTESGYYVTSYEGDDEVVIIPDEYLGKSVVGIKDGAFNSSNIKKIYFPEGLEYVSSKAFSTCPRLEFFSENGLNYIGSRENPYMFLAGCDDVEILSVDINPKTVFIGDSVFFGSWLVSVTGGEGVKYVGDFAFKNSKALAEISFLKSVSYIGEEGFYSTSIKSLNLRSDATLGKRAFMYCTKLETLVLPSEIETVPEEAFSNCTSLREIYLGAKLVKIETYAFFSLSERAEIYYPKSEADFSEIIFCGNFTPHDKDCIYYNYSR